MKKIKLPPNLWLMIIVAALFVFIVTAIPGSPDLVSALGSTLLALMLLAGEVGLYLVGRKHGREFPVHAILWTDRTREGTEKQWAKLLASGKLRFIVEYADARQATLTVKEDSEEATRLLGLLSRENTEQLERLRGMQKTL